MDTTKILKGDDLMIFDASGKSIAFATSHTLTISADTQEVNCKDSGMWKDNFVTKMGFEITTENLYSWDGYAYLFDKMVKGEAFKVYFGQPNPNKIWDASSGSTGAEKNITSKEFGIGSPTESWYAKGQDIKKMYAALVVISSLTVNAASGDNATMSATLSGVGKIQQVPQVNDNSATVQIEDSEFETATAVTE